MQVREKKCNQCDKSFADDRHLREHVMAIHDKLKPFGCEICDFKCARIDNLNTHRKKIHGIDNKLTRAQHDTWIVQGKHPYIRCMIGGAEAKHQHHPHHQIDRSFDFKHYRQIDMCTSKIKDMKTFSLFSILKCGQKLNSLESILQINGHMVLCEQK